MQDLSLSQLNLRTRAADAGGNKPAGGAREQLTSFFDRLSDVAATLERRVRGQRHA